MKKRMTNQRATASQTETHQPALPTFADHLQELKSRLFWVAIYFVVASAIAYPFFQQIVHIVTAPLGGQQLYYLTPGGGLAFIIKVCMYIGVIAILPVLVYHLYKFIAPVMKQENARSVMAYTIASSVLALAGIVFAYAVTLPAAIQFLTTINLDQISSMLTIDSYMSFVIGYVIAGALLFQLPLVMLMINSLTPLSPGKLMSFQRYMIVGSFIVAAIVSPTPDVVNQTILAAPMVVMYQVGIVAVWLRNRRRTVLAPRATVATPARSAAIPAVAVSQPVVPSVHTAAISPTGQQRPQGKVMDMVAPSTRRVPVAVAPAAPQIVRRAGSLDGMRRPVLARRPVVVPQRPVMAEHVKLTHRSSDVAQPILRGLIPTI